MNFAVLKTNSTDTDYFVRWEDKYVNDILEESGVGLIHLNHPFIISGGTILSLADKPVETLNFQFFPRHV